MSAVAGAGAIRIPQNTCAVSKPRTSGAVMKIGNIFTRITDIFNKSQETDSSIHYPPAWIHNPEGNIKLATFGTDRSLVREKYFYNAFAELYPGAIIGTSVGYMSPYKTPETEPEYSELLSGSSGHVEVLQILYNSDKCS